MLNANEVEYLKLLENMRERILASIVKAEEFKGLTFDNAQITSHMGLDVFIFKLNGESCMVYLHPGMTKAQLIDLVAKCIAEKLV